MKTADLYIRVSTDEQADKGYSQRNQEEVLRRYCDINGIQIRRAIFEDHSAKTFNRPAWTKLLIDLKKKCGATELVLFTKWDRFSRNAGDAYQMINILRKYGVEPQAIEQPLDLSIPENKMMLAFYLAAPEVENDRRALNVFFGMRRARKEGRWMGPAPIGYVNKTKEDGRKYITPDEKNGPLMTEVFHMLAESAYNTEQVLKIIRKKGLKCSKNNFWLAIRNPMYCGKIFIPKYKDEENMLVKGQHEPLISEALFHEVQDVLDGRKRKQRVKQTVDKNLPLRGFLVCPKCGRSLTGSASRGKRNYYHYYHCSRSTCKIRFSAIETNRLFDEKIKQYFPKPGMSELYRFALIDTYYRQTDHRVNERKQLIREIEALEARLKNARNKYADLEMPAEDFFAIKNETMEAVKNLESKLSQLGTRERGIEQLVDTALEKLLRIRYLYEKGTIIEKRRVVCSIFPQKWIFNGSEHRTPRINEAASLIYAVDVGLVEIKNGTKPEISDLSRKADWTGLEPVSAEPRPCQCIILLIF